MAKLPVDPKNLHFITDGYQPLLSKLEQKGFQPTSHLEPGKVQGGYQGPTGQGAPANPPSGGSSGKKK